MYRGLVVRHGTSHYVYSNGARVTHVKAGRALKTLGPHGGAMEVPAQGQVCGLIPRPQDSEAVRPGGLHGWDQGTSEASLHP